MSDVATKSEMGQVLDAVRSIQSDIQAMDKKLDIHIATTAEKFNTVQAEIKGVRTEIKAVEEKLSAEIKGVRTEIKAVEEKLSIELQGVRSEVKTVDGKVEEIRNDQKTTDNRVWALIVALLAGMISVSVFLGRIVLTMPKV